MDVVRVNNHLNNESEVKMYSKKDWQIAKSLDGNLGVRTEDGFICFLAKPFHYSGQDDRFIEEIAEYEDNAKLIAAAPDLLKAAEDLVFHLINNGIPYSVLKEKIKVMQEVIAKAEK